MSQQNEQFENLIRQTLENFEVDYNPAHWSELENRLNLIGQGVLVSMNTFYTAFAVAGVFLAGLVFFGLPEDSGNKFNKGQNIAVIETEDLGDGKLIIEKDETKSSDSIGFDINNQNRMDGSENIENAADGLSETIDSGNPSKTIASTAQTASKVKSIKSKVVFGNSDNKTVVYQGCEGMPVHFATELDKEAGNYLWNFGDGFFSNDVNPEHTFSEPGVFDVSLLVTPLTGGKIRPMTIEDKIKINPRPKASFDYSYQLNYLNVPQVKFENHSSQAEQVIWKVGDEVISTENNPTYNFAKKGTYKVELIAINEFGCEDVTFKNVVIKEDYNLMAPHEFTPDGDGKSDTFMPEALKLIEGTFTLKIFDSKTNMVIFESADYNKPWDGKIAGTNVKASRDVYPWVVNINYRYGGVDEFKGEIKLKR
jgi:gliding motility-associated-like protein